MTKLYFGWRAALMVLLAAVLICSCGGGGGNNGVLPISGSVRVTVVGYVVDLIGGNYVPGATVTVRGTNHAALYTAKSLPDGSYTVTVPARTDIYFDINGEGYAAMNTPVFNFSSDMMGDLAVIPAATGKYMADAFSGQILGNSWSDAAYAGSYWLSLDIYDPSDNDVQGITVAAQPGGSTIVYNNGSDVFSTTAPSHTSYNLPLVGAFGVSPGIYTLFLTDELGNSQHLTIPLVRGEITYAFVQWQEIWGFSVSGKVTAANGSAVRGVTVSLVTGSYTTASTTSDKDGQYSFINQISGTYSVNPSCTSVDCSFTPSAMPVTIAGHNATVPDIVINQSTTPSTDPAAFVSERAARLNGSYTNPFGAQGSAWFEYGTTTEYGSTTGTSWISGTATGTAALGISGLSPLTTYHYRIVTQVGGLTFYGNDAIFTTLIMPEVLASGQELPKFLAVDAENVYWSDYSSVRKVSKSDRTLTVLASGLNDPWQVAVDDINVYWAEYYGFAVKKVGINGGVVTTLASCGNEPYLTIDADNVYWTGNGISKVSKNGGTTLKLSTGSATGIAVDSQNVYWTEYGTSGAVKKMPITGGLAVTLASAAYAISIAVDSNSVYFSDGGQIKKVGSDIGVVTSLTSQHHGVYALTIDSTAVYWIEANDWQGVAVKKVSKDGGMVTTLAQSESDNYFSVAVDDTYVYWAASGKILRVPKSY